MRCWPTTTTTTVTSRFGYRLRQACRRALIKTEPNKFFMPPYVGLRGWVGIELDRIGDEELAPLLAEAWQLIAPKTLRAKPRPSLLQRRRHGKILPKHFPGLLVTLRLPGAARNI
jgi:hypothetical protein